MREQAKEVALITQKTVSVFEDVDLTSREIKQIGEKMVAFLEREIKTLTAKKKLRLQIEKALQSFLETESLSLNSILEKYQIQGYVKEQGIILMQLIVEKMESYTSEEYDKLYAGLNDLNLKTGGVFRVHNKEALVSFAKHQVK